MAESVMQVSSGYSPSRTSEVQARVRGWQWAALIGGRAVRRALSASVTYGEDGSAVFEMETDADLRGLGRAPVRVVCGWGALRTLLFEGTLSDPIRDPFRSTTFVNAYGVRGAMASQSFDRYVDYTGFTLPRFFHEISRRLYDSRAVIDVRHGFDVFLEQADFEGESTLLEAADSVVGPVGHVMLDRPDFDLLVSPEPAPAVGTSANLVFDASSWAPGDLELNPASDQIVSKVVVFRRETIGESSEAFEVVRAEAKVSNPGPYYPKPNEIHWIPDFPGDQASAQRTADATAFSRGTANYGGQMQNVWAEPRLVPPKPFRLVRLEEDGEMRVTYAARAKSNTVDLVSAKMSVTLAALKEGSVGVLSRGGQGPSPIPKRSSHVIRTVYEPTALFGREFDLPGGRIWVDPEFEWNVPTPFYGREEDGRIWLDPELASPATLVESGLGREPDGRIFVDV